ncbi:CAZyme family AA7 [Penicillium canescens]|uniref:CAZyme family AA7 n=1 Tax=Penicillium canescens TaxID=5083 RepID=A0AAD6N8N8_PENCN|nr:CAZyme family AA7 [Penicillium canescens]KAJ6043393.1 CAZyme family AA7 [Penicillium canescens]KAJ6054870.1 CAZyme family AA7 [Penicillium canescens]KAJ6073814.1 CAZyme family AA7 [Penicillium canescens]
MLQISCASMVNAASALAFLALFFPASATPSGYNCNPGQHCWPSNKEWEIFNSSLSGNLYRTIPYAASCYYSSPYYDRSTCDVIEGNYTTNQARTDVYGATTGLNWESCLSQTCALNIYAPTSSVVLSDECYLGRLSSLYVDAREAKHVVIAVKFAQKHSLRVTIKNTGHDYFGRSTSPNTLTIWTHNMKTMKYHANFTASNCPASNGQHIGEIGAGAQALDVYTYFQSVNMDVTGGNEGSVGLAGGFGQGGGHGVFGPSYGLMVDNAVEFDVVTADGQLRTINRCNDPGLFWAMRGGGGGSFGILTSYRFQLHPAVKINVYQFKANFTLHGNETANYAVLEQILTQHATYQPVWSHINISGHAYYWPSKAEIYLVLPSNNETALKTLTSEFSSFLTNQTGISVTTSTYTTYPKYTNFLQVTNTIASRLTPGGIFEAVAGRLMPNSLFETDATINDLVEAVLRGIRLSNKLVPDDASLTQVIMTTPVNHQNGNTTSANPAWRTALWHVLMTGGWTKELGVSNETALLESWLNTVQPLKDLTPGGGCYLNEGHYLEPEWQETFFGSNYPELLDIKKKYDPTHFFDCWKCVGWEGPSDAYYCYN